MMVKNCETIFLHESDVPDFQTGKYIGENQSEFGKLIVISSPLSMLIVLTVVKPTWSCAIF